MSDIDLLRDVITSPPSVALAYLAFLLLREALRGQIKQSGNPGGTGPHVEPVHRCDKTE